MHRLLAAALEIAKLPPVFHDGPQLTSIADSKAFYLDFLMKLDFDNSISSNTWILFRFELPAPKCTNGKPSIG